MSKPKHGLSVKYCQDVVSFSADGIRRNIKLAYQDGWFVMVWHRGQYKPLMELRFAREKDAARAASDLTAAGLDTANAIQSAKPMTVLEVATRNLQW